MLGVDTDLDRTDPDPHVPDADPDSDAEPANFMRIRPIRIHNTGFMYNFMLLNDEW